MAAEAEAAREARAKAIQVSEIRNPVTKNQKSEIRNPVTKNMLTMIMTPAALYPYTVERRDVFGWEMLPRAGILHQSEFHHALAKNL